MILMLWLQRVCTLHNRARKSRLHRHWPSIHGRSNVAKNLVALKSGSIMVLPVNNSWTKIDNDCFVLHVCAWTLTMKHPDSIISFSAQTITLYSFARLMCRKVTQGDTTSNLASTYHVWEIVICKYMDLNLVLVAKHMIHGLRIFKFQSFIASFRN